MPTSRNRLTRWIIRTPAISPANRLSICEIEPALLGFTGQNAGNVIAVIHNGEVIGSAVFFEDDPRPGAPDVVAAIKAQPWRDGEIRTVKLGSLGLIPGEQPKCRSPMIVLVVGVSLDLVNKPSAAESSVRQCFR